MPCGHAESCFQQMIVDYLQLKNYQIGVLLSFNKNHQMTNLVLDRHPMVLKKAF
jgi:hypothetical protein